MICFKFVIRAERKPGENKCIITTNRNGFFCGDPDRWAAKKKKKNVNLNQIGVGDSKQCQDQNIT